MSTTACYRIHLEADSDYPGGVDVTIPAFPTVFTQADDASGAFKNAREAIESDLSFRQRRGLAYPASDAAPDDVLPCVVVTFPSAIAP